MEQCGIYFIIKMIAVIKKKHSEHLQVLEELLFSKVHPRDNKINLVKLPFFNLTALLVTVYSQYTRQRHTDTLNLFILEYFQMKYESSFEIYRHMMGLILMWKKYANTHEQSRMYLSMLQPQRCSRDNIKMFLKVRKNILRTVGTKLMQQIILTHQDVITLVHTLFVTDMKAYTSKKMHQLFFSLKKKSRNATKVNGAVICQFLINCIEKYERQELSNIFQESQHRNSSNCFKRSISPANRSIQRSYNQNHSSRESQRDFTEMTGVFVLPSTTKPLEHNFLINNLSTLSPHRARLTLTPQKALHQKYSYSWQKFIQTNQEIKQKLLHSRSEY